MLNIHIYGYFWTLPTVQFSSQYFTLFQCFRVNWSNHLQMFCKKIVLKTFTKFTGKHLYQSFFLNKTVDKKVTEDTWPEMGWTLIETFKCAPHKKCPWLEFFWFVFFRIRIIRSIRIPVIQRDMEYFSVFTPNAQKYRSEKLRIRTLFTQWCLLKKQIPGYALWNRY